jgi:hypothetical protein
VEDKVPSSNRRSRGAQLNRLAVLASNERRSFMLIGAHAVIYSTNPDADRAFLRDVIKLTNVDAGGGYVIFGLPPSEVAVHQHDKNDVHEFYLMCADVEARIEELKGHNVVCGPVQDEGWGLLTRVMLPGGGKLGIYQPRHPRPAATSEEAPKGVAKRAVQGPTKKSRKAKRKARRR